MSSIDSVSSPPTATRSRERTAIAALATAAFALSLNTNVLGALLPFARDDLSLAGTREKYLLAAAAIGSAFGALSVGLFTRRFSQKAVLIGGLWLFVIASLGHLVTTEYAPFLALRLVSGFAVGVAYASASSLAAEVSPYGRRGAAMGIFSAGMFLAIPIGLPLTVWLAKAGHWQWIFGVQAGIGVLGAWFAQRSLPTVPGDLPRVFMLSVLGKRGVAAGLLANLLHVGSFFTTIQLATTWLDQTGLVVKEDQQWLWLGLGAASVAGSALLGRLSDAMGKRNFVLLTSAVLVACFGMLAGEPGPTPMFWLGTLLAVTAAARTGPLQALLSGLVPGEQMPALMGLRGFSMQLGVFLFAIGAAQLPPDFGFRGVLLLAAGCQLLSYVAIRLGVRERGA